jgi:hypothetical protein
MLNSFRSFSIEPEDFSDPPAEARKRMREALGERWLALYPMAADQGNPDDCEQPSGNSRIKGEHDQRCRDRRDPERVNQVVQWRLMLLSIVFHQILHPISLLNRFPFEYFI